MVVWGLGSWIGFLGLGFSVDGACGFGLSWIFGVGALYIYIHRRLTLGKKLCKYHLVSDRYCLLIYLRCTCTQSFDPMALSSICGLTDHKRAEYLSLCWKQQPVQLQLEVVK